MGQPAPQAIIEASTKHALVEEGGGAANMFTFSPRTTNTLDEDPVID